MVDPLTFLKRVQPPWERTLQVIHEALKEAEEFFSKNTRNPTEETAADIQTCLLFFSGAFNVMQERARRRRAESEGSFLAWVKVNQLRDIENALEHCDAAAKLLIGEVVAANAVAEKSPRAAIAVAKAAVQNRYNAATTSMRGRFVKSPSLQHTYGTYIDKFKELFLSPRSITPRVVQAMKRLTESFVTLTDVIKNTISTRLYPYKSSLESITIINRDYASTERIAESITAFRETQSLFKRKGLADLITTTITKIVLIDSFGEVEGMGNIGGMYIPDEKTLCMPTAMHARDKFIYCLTHEIGHKLYYEDLDIAARKFFSHSVDATLGETLTTSISFRLRSELYKLLLKHGGDHTKAIQEMNLDEKDLFKAHQLLAYFVITFSKADRDFIPVAFMLRSTLRCLKKPIRPLMALFALINNERNETESESDGSPAGNIVAVFAKASKIEPTVKDLFDLSHTRDTKLLPQGPSLKLPKVLIQQLFSKKFPSLYARTSSSETFAEILAHFILKPSKLPKEALKLFMDTLRKSKEANKPILTLEAAFRKYANLLEAANSYATLGQPRSSCLASS